VVPGLTGFSPGETPGLLVDRRAGWTVADHPIGVQFQALLIAKQASGENCGNPFAKR
jgi:hypothetical protein